MKININEYRVCKPLVLKAYEKGGILEVSFQIGGIGCPLIAAYYYCVEEYGMTEGLQKKINSLTKFYGYSKIEGYEEK
tara:strand:+ start:144 stop:377 length:234 start_codon:yes stop_codon:yes gene_type:complete